MSDAFIWYCDDCTNPATGEEGRYHLAHQQDDHNFYDEDGDLVWDSNVVDADGNRTPEGAEEYPPYREQQDEWMHYFVSVAETGDDYLGEMIRGADTPAEAAATAWQHVERIAGEQGLPLPPRPAFAPAGAAAPTLYDELEDSGISAQYVPDPNAGFDPDR